jgi:hypothetical protein
MIVEQRHAFFEKQLLLPQNTRDNSPTVYLLSATIIIAPFQ